MDIITNIPEGLFTSSFIKLGFGIEATSFFYSRATFYRLDLGIKSTFMNIFVTSSFSKLGFDIEFFFSST